MKGTYHEHLIEKMMAKEQHSINVQTNQPGRLTLEQILENEKVKTPPNTTVLGPTQNVGSKNTRQSDDIFKTQFYQTKFLKDKTLYMENYGDKTELAKEYNEDVSSKTNNFQKTQISEYSNAIHNNRVFVNPRYLSCWLIFKFNSNILNLKRNSQINQFVFLN